MISPLLFSLVSALSVGPNLIQNGSFEDGAEKVCPRPAAWCISNKPEGIAPWYVSSANKDYEVDHSPSPWPAHHGVWSMDLNGNAPYTISQNVELTVGKSYTLTFMLNENNCGVPDKTGFVSATGAPVQNFSHVNNEGWKLISYTFEATAKDTVISIGATSAGSCGSVIDSVQLRKSLKCKP
jgi:hypothetical protein